MKFSYLLKVVRAHIKPVIIGTILCTLLGCAYAAWSVRSASIDEAVNASTTMYITVGAETAEELGQSDDTFDSREVMMSNVLVTYLGGDAVKQEAGSRLGLTDEDLVDYTVGLAINDATHIVTLTVNGADGEVAANMANMMVSLAQEWAGSIDGISAVNQINRAMAPQEDAAITSNASTTRSAIKKVIKFGIIGFCAGLFVIVQAIIVIFTVVKPRVMDRRDLEGLIDAPVVGVIPTVRGK